MASPVSGSELPQMQLAKEIYNSTPLPTGIADLVVSLLPDSATYDASTDRFWTDRFDNVPSDSLLSPKEKSQGPISGFVNRQIHQAATQEIRNWTSRTIGMQGLKLAIPNEWCYESYRHAFGEIIKDLTQPELVSYARAQTADLRKHDPVGMRRICFIHENQPRQESECYVLQNEKPLTLTLTKNEEINQKIQDLRDQTLVKAFDSSKCKELLDRVFPYFSQKITEKMKNLSAPIRAQYIRELFLLSKLENHPHNLSQDEILDFESMISEKKDECLVEFFDRWEKELADRKLDPIETMQVAYFRKKMSEIKDLNQPEKANEIRKWLNEPFSFLLNPNLFPDVYEDALPLPFELAHLPSLSVQVFAQFFVQGINYNQIELIKKMISSETFKLIPPTENDQNPYGFDVIFKSAGVNEDIIKLLIATDFYKNLPLIDLSSTFAKACEKNLVGLTKAFLDSSRGNEILTAYTNSNPSDIPPEIKRLLRQYSKKAQHSAASSAAPQT